VLLSERLKATDQTVGDIEVVCKSFGAMCTPPTGGGSHYKVAHPNQAEILTIPARRPIKSVYIKHFVAFINMVRPTMDIPSYTVIIEPLADEDGGGFLARVPDLPGCMSDGETDFEAHQNAHDAITEWIDQARKMNRPIPRPAHQRQVA
jgi:predicted RNase H-like HicB family nuclease